VHILITGGTGFIGKALIHKLKKRCHFTVITRKLSKAHSIFGDEVQYLSSLNQLSNLDGYNAVINLAGEPIANKRWTKKQKQNILYSRLDMTQDLVKLFKRSEYPPKVFISGSAIGYYGQQDTHQVITESFTHCNNEFSHQLCDKWESIASAVQDITRLCILRTGIVLGKNGGAIKKMSPSFKLGLGGKMGHGQQMMSWIHIDDMVNAISHLLENEVSRGAYNLTAPMPVNNQEFSLALADSLDSPCGFDLPAWLIKLLMGEMSELLLTGQRVIPERLLQEGFQFKYKTLEKALSRINAPSSLLW
jgi:uncharacterized protein (TIGR01777 family)